MSCRPTLFYYIISFTSELRWNNFSRAQQELDQSDFYYFDQKNVYRLSSYLLGSKKSHKKSYAYLTDSQ